MQCVPSKLGFHQRCAPSALFPERFTPPACLSPRPHHSLPPLFSPPATTTSHQHTNESDNSANTYTLAQARWDTMEAIEEAAYGRLSSSGLRHPAGFSMSPPRPCSSHAPRASGSGRSSGAAPRSLDPPLPSSARRGRHQGGHGARSESVRQPLRAQPFGSLWGALMMGASESDDERFGYEYERGVHGRWPAASGGRGGRGGHIPGLFGRGLRLDSGLGLSLRDALAVGGRSANLPPNLLFR